MFEFNIYKKQGLRESEHTKEIVIRCMLLKLEIFISKLHGAFPLSKAGGGFGVAFLFFVLFVQKSRLFQTQFKPKALWQRQRRKQLNERTDRIKTDIHISRERQRN